MPGQVQWGTYLGGGDAIRRGIGGVGDAFMRYGALQMDVARNAEQRAWQQAQAEESRRRWEAGMQLDRRSEQRRTTGAALDAMASARTAAEVDAAVRGYGPLMPGYREGTEPFEVPAPKIEGYGNLTSSMAPGAPAYNPLARVGRPRVAEIEAAASAPDTFTLRGMDFPYTPQGRREAAAFERQISAARRAPETPDGPDSFTVAGRQFPDTPEGRNAAVEWRERLYGREDPFELGSGGPGLLSGPDEPAPHPSTTVDGRLIRSTVPPGTPMRPPVDDSLRRRMFSDLLPDQSAPSPGTLRGPTTRVWRFRNGETVSIDSVEAAVRRALAAGASDRSIVEFMTEQGEPENDVREIIRRVRSR